ncbi:MAG: hypothetical protein U9N62_13080 [Thermotogota bacterium]|nr:hypothetical protein [Thermotogota bacterium]
MPSRNPFMSRVKRLMTGREDDFNGELGNISGPRRIFQARTEAVLVNERLMEKQFQNYSLNNLEHQDICLYKYQPFGKDALQYGINFFQEAMLKETTGLFYLNNKKFKDERPKREIFTDLLMIVFWTNLMMGYFEHMVESEVYKLKSLNVLKKGYNEYLEEEEIKELIKHLSLAYAFRNLSEIASNSGIPTGNPFDYQWVARFYIMKKIEDAEKIPMDFIGDTRWYDGIEKLFHKFFADNKKREYFFFSEKGIDSILNIPIYLIVEDDMPIFETTIKSSPRTLEDFMREAKPSNRKFFREILSMVEYSFELSINLNNDVGLSVEKGAGEILFELFPETYIHSMLASYSDIICIPEITMLKIREYSEDLISKLLKTGFEADSEGKLTLILDHKISRERWILILDLLRGIAAIK